MLWGVWVLALLGEIYFLVHDLSIFSWSGGVPREYRPHGSEDAIAELVSHRKQVHVQEGGGLVWQSARAGERLFEGQSVLTSEDSAADIAFGDGFGIILGENSLVQIERRHSGGPGGPIVVRLLRGSLHRALRRENVNAPSQQQAAPIEIAAGTSSVVTFSPDAEFSVHATPVEGDAAQAAPVLEVREGSASVSEAGSTPVQASAGETILADRTVAPMTKKGAAATPAEVRLPAPRIVLPEVGAFRDSGERVLLVWEEVEGASRYEIELSTSARQLSSEEPLFELQGISEGVHSWKVRAVAPDGKKGDWSTDGRFEVRSRSLAPPPPSRILKPKFVPQSSRRGEAGPLGRMVARLIGHYLSLWVTESAAASVGGENKDFWSVKLAWEPVPGIKKYRVQIARTQAFNRILDDAITEGPDYTWPYRRGLENSKGRVFFRIASVSESGEPGTFSDPVAIEIPREILVAAGRAAPKEEKAPAETPRPTTWRWDAALSLGLGDLTQSSRASNLRAVHVGSVYLQQKFSASASLLQGRRGYFTRLDLGLAGFGRPSGTSTTQQEDMTGMTLEWSILTAARSGDETVVPLGWGLVLDRSFRWSKDGVQTVTSEGGFSVGPVIVLDWRRFGTRLSLPLTGILTGTQYGGRFSAWGEWAFATFWKRQLALRGEAETDYFRWKTPEGTSIFGWRTWVSFVIRDPWRTW